MMSTNHKNDNPTYRRNTRIIAVAGMVLGVMAIIIAVAAAFD